MANVQLPNINITNNDIDSASLPQLQKIVKSLLNTTVILTEELTYLLNNLDTRNVNEIDGDILVTGTVTAAKMLVEELSAITANMGKLTSGEIYGAYIATKENAYPRAEMSNTNDLFGAYQDASNYVDIVANYHGVPSLNIIQNGNIVGRINALTGSLEITAIGFFDLYSSGTMSLVPANPYNLRIPPFSRVVTSNGYNLGAELDNKAVAGISTNPSGSHNHGIPDGTVLRTADGGTVTFYSAPQHTHEQTS